MDFSTRGSQINQSANHMAGAEGPHHGKKRKRSAVDWLKYASVILLFSATILVVALLASVVIGGPKNETQYVDTSKYQAVFLNGGQVYFGHILSLNNKYMRLSNIYYLRVNQQVQPNGKQQSSSPELVPLGCELHRPQNEMVINKEQVTFWENLKADDNLNTVPGAIKKYVADHPNGQQCTAATNATSGQ